jgi:hypothetical protein
VYNALCSSWKKGNGEKGEKREMKTWVLVLILALGILAVGAGAQTTSSTTTNFPSANPPLQGPNNPTAGAPLTTATNPASTLQPFNASTFQGVPQTRTGVQTTGMTNVSLGIPSQTTLGAPSIIEANPTAGSSFQSRSGGQAATTSNAASTLLPRQSEATAGQPSNASTFLFASSAQSLIGQGQGVLAAATNGYNVSLFQISPNSLRFNISAANSVAITNWLLEFSTTNDFFTAGIYSNAVNAGGGPTRLVFSGMGRSDNNSAGAFKVLEATYSSNQIVSFAADFVQFDNYDTNSWNEGSIRYNSTIPDTVRLLMAPVAISFKKGNAVLTWSTNLAGFQLEYATNLPPEIWFTNDSVPAIVDGQYTVTNAISGGPHLYRLMKPL